MWCVFYGVCERMMLNYQSEIIDVKLSKGMCFYVELCVKLGLMLVNAPGWGTSNVNKACVCSACN